MAKDTLWFPHDYNARADEKTAALIADHGVEGYGLYMVLIEMLHEEDSAKIEYSDQKIKRICRPLKIEIDTAKEIIDDCISEYELFIVKEGFFYSDRVLRNKEEREAIRLKRVNAGKKGGEANASRFEANASQNESNAKAMLKQNEANGTTGHNNNNTREDKKKNKEELFMSKEVEFGKSLVPFTSEFGKELVRTFFDYWREPNKSRTKMRWENERTWDLKLRLQTFQRNEKNFGKKETLEIPDNRLKGFE